MSHSYCVGLNRRLAHELARAQPDRWAVVAVAPPSFPGDLQPHVLESIANEPCRVEAVPVHFARTIHVMVYGRRLRSILDQGFDVIHCWEEPFLLAGGQIAWWAPPRSKLVYATFQNLCKSYPPPWSWIERYSLERAAGWIAYGQTVAQTLHDRPGYRRRPHRVIPLGVDIEVFQPSAAAGVAVRQELGWAASGPPVVGFLGRFVPEKGLGMLMRVLDALPVPWRALLVGGGPMQTSLDQWARRHGDRVRVVTGVSHDGVPRYLNAMDLLCAPSQSTPHWREQLGRMLLEAFACGVPVMASDCGEIPFVVADAALVIPERDEKQWGEQLARLLENSAWRKELAERGRQRATQEFAWPRIAQRMWDFFEELA